MSRTWTRAACSRIVAGSVEATPPAGEPAAAGPRIGVLAVQGGFQAHCDALRRLGAVASEVRRPGHLGGLDALVLPGGESTTMSIGIESYGLDQPIRDFVGGGRPVFGTCAGLIMLDRAHMCLMDIEARRNAFGRQVRSFEQDLHVQGLGDEPLRAVFIRAPWIEKAGDEVEVLAEVDGHPVVAREQNMLVAAFHPELTDDLRLHALFLAMEKGRSSASSRAGSLRDRSLS
jgi:pyridoxal 5'-phosphate synthase pdxT subunit